MTKRSMIRIDEDLCTGCGECIPGCPEGALQIVDGKAKLVSEVLCDGLGACLGDCPEGALTVEEREAPAYDEAEVVRGIIPRGHDVLRAHLAHLKEHEQWDDLRVAREVLRAEGIDPHAGGPAPLAAAAPEPCGCPGARAFAFDDPPAAPAADAVPVAVSEAGERPSLLSHWPIQLHLISPAAPYFKGRDLLLSADCVAYSLGGFHQRFLDGRAVAIACPKLDQGQDVYLQKLIALIDEARVNTLTVLTMEVPCCSGLLRMAQTAAQRASRKVPVRAVNVGIKGDILSDEWV